MKPSRYCLVAALWFGTQAHAQTVPMMTINFNVPVQLSNYPGSRAAVWCELLNPAGQPLAPPAVNGQAAGVGLSYVSVNAGAANVSVPVSVSVPRESAPLARGWRCVLATTDRYAPDRRGAGSMIPRDLVPLAEVRGTL